MRYAIIDEKKVVLGLMDLEDRAHADLIEVGDHRKVECADAVEVGDTLAPAGDEQHS